MNQTQILLVGEVIIIAVVFYVGYKMLPEHEKAIPIRTLTNKEAEWMADYFRSLDPDEDGYVGHYTLPKEVMEIYNKKYRRD